MDPIKLHDFPFFRFVDPKYWIYMRCWPPHIESQWIPPGPQAPNTSTKQGAVIELDIWIFSWHHTCIYYYPLLFLFVCVFGEQKLMWFWIFKTSPAQLISQIILFSSGKDQINAQAAISSNVNTKSIECEIHEWNNFLMTSRGETGFTHGFYQTEVEGRQLGEERGRQKHSGKWKFL